MRLFCAVTPPPGWIKILGELRSLLEKRQGNSVRWVDPGLSHLTVRFIGEVDDAKAHDLMSVWPTITLPPDPLVLELTACGCFPEQGPERVLWAGAEARTGSWRSLVQYADAILANLGLTWPESEPVAHITIGRVRRPGEVWGIREELAAIALHSEPFTVHSMGLFSSAPTPSGSRYSLLASTCSEVSNTAP